MAGDDWYQRRRQDAEGTFFRGVANQGPRKGEGGGTRQGIYCLTASGRLLAFKNPQDAEHVKEILAQGLRAWNRLPEEERRPGAVKVPELSKVDAHYAPAPPEGGVILNVFTRILDHDGKGEVVRGTCAFAGGDQAARDHLWLTRGEWQSLVPADLKPGDEFPMPQALAERLACYHLIDNTRGEPPFWAREEIRKTRLTWKVEDVTEDAVRLSLEGKVLLATAADPAKAERGYDVAIRGSLRYDRRHKTIDRLEILAVGDHWGAGTYTPGERPGRKPLGVFLELSNGATGADRVPPQGIKTGADYYWGRVRGE